ncbi:nitronate monooxygenase [Ideonella sp. TBM-1]|uniref:Propionate 3-nitronate monooxygenase n=2 Tax=Ideonella livida TaxID=2707176 RepID=A0A7C9PJM1_9BURK|nr:nitronate monooxygenase [Ideonella livida]
MAGVQGHRLALAVCAAGGLGSLPAAMLSMATLQEELAVLSQRAAGPWNLNFFCHRPPAADMERMECWRVRLAPYARELGLMGLAPPAGPARQPFGPEAAALVARYRPPVVSFHFGLPAAPLLQQVRESGAQVWSTATTVDEARWLAAQGVDAVIVQGLEAGGHRGHFLRPDLDLDGQAPLADLLPAVRQALAASHPGLPLIAAGGLSSPQDVAAVRAAGAVAAQVGTAYLLSAEADTSRVHRAALRAAAQQGPGATLTALTNVFSGRPARGLLNRLMREQGPLSPEAPAFPLAATALGPLRQAAEGLGRGDFTPLWSGENLEALREQPEGEGAAALTRWLAGQ